VSTSSTVVVDNDSSSASISTAMSQVSIITSFCVQTKKFENLVAK